MGFWANLLTHKKKRVGQFEDASSAIREGVTLRLTERFEAIHGPETGKLLAAAVVGELFCRQELEPEIRDFAKANGKLVRESIGSLADETEMRRAVSVLMLVTAGILRKQPNAFKDEFRSNPLDNLRELEFFLEGTTEPSADEFLRMAEEFRDASSQRGVGATTEELTRKHG